MRTSFYSDEEIRAIGFKSVGKDVLISRNTGIYGAGDMSIGDNVRIDDFCILSGNIILGSRVHISAYCALYGSAGICLSDYCGMSARSIIYSASDDYSGEFLVGACVEERFRHVIRGKVTLQKFVQLGAGTIVMPSLTLEEGVATGAMTFVNQSLDAWGIYVGIPARRLGERSRKMIDFL